MKNQPQKRSILKKIIMLPALLLGIYLWFVGWMMTWFGSGRPKEKSVLTNNLILIVVPLQEVEP
jgi:hypothetical protein